MLVMGQLGIRTLECQTLEFVDLRKADLTRLRENGFDVFILFHAAPSYAGDAAGDKRDFIVDKLKPAGNRIWPVLIVQSEVSQSVCAEKTSVDVEIDASGPEDSRLELGVKQVCRVKAVADGLGPGRDADEIVWTVIFALTGDFG